jgi:hypothetical protein
MNERLAAIQRRRDALISRANGQRQALADLVEPWRAGLVLTDRAMALGREIRSHWFTLAAGGVLISRVGRGPLGVWLARIWTGWKLYRALRKAPPPS